MYFHYPTWLGSMPDPSLVPPPPVVFKPYYFKPEKSTSANYDKDQYNGSYADDDIGVDYGPEYIRPRPMPYPPPPNPPKKEDYFDYWAYTRFYNARPYPFSHAHEYPPFPRVRQYGYMPSAYDYRFSYSHLHPHPHPHLHPHPHPHPHPQPHAPHSKHPRNSWSTQEATKAWRAKQRKVWEEWESRAGEARPQPSSTSRPSETNDGWREGWCPPRSPSPARSDSGWQDSAGSYANGRSEEHGHDTDQREEQWSRDYRSHQPEAPFRSFYMAPSESRLSEAFALYCRSWETLLSPGDSKRLIFRNIPWPQYPSPRSVEDIDVQNVRAFLMAAGRPLKVCLREALLRFHPDKTPLLLVHVAEKDKADVAAGCEAVTRCLSQLMKSATL